MRKADNRDWSRYYRLGELDEVQALHGRFQTHRYPKHTHDYFVIGLIERGAESFFYRGAQRVATAGQAFVISPDEPHTGEPLGDEGYVCRNLYLNETYLRRFGTLPCFPAAAINDSMLAAKLSRFHASLTKPVSRLEQECLLLEATAHLLKHHAETASDPIVRERPAVAKACEYIQTYFHLNLSLNALASLVSLSPFHFARAFKNGTGLPPHAYLEGVRIQRARERLDSGNSIVSTALTVGYADQSHLTRRFKHHLGITPGQYLQSRKIRQDRNRR